MKKILFSLGSVAVVAAPFAALVSCGDKKVEAPFKATTRTDAEIVKDLTEWVNDSLAIGASPSFGDHKATIPISGPATVTEDWTKEYWNKPEGETFRLAAITNAIGGKIWSYAPGMVSPGDAVVRAIVFGVQKELESKNELTKNVPVLNKDDIKRVKEMIKADWDKLATNSSGAPLFADQAAFETWVDSFLGKTYDEITDAIAKANITDQTLISLPKNIDAYKRLASNQLNIYKVELIKNIESTLSKFDATSSLQKFDGFINWFIDSKDNYQNLKETMIAGKITKNVIQGIQDELNKPSDPMITGGKTDIVIIESTV